VTPAQRRAMKLAAELDIINCARARRQRVIAGLPLTVFSPAGLAAYLMGTAQLDQRRRQLRALLADQLAAVAEEMSTSNVA